MWRIANTWSRKWKDVTNSLSLAKLTRIITSWDFLIGMRALSETGPPMHDRRAGNLEAVKNAIKVAQEISFWALLRFPQPEWKPLGWIFSIKLLNCSFRANKKQRRSLNWRKNWCNASNQALWDYFGQYARFTTDEEPNALRHWKKAKMNAKTRFHGDKKEANEKDALYNYLYLSPQNLWITSRDNPAISA